MHSRHVDGNSPQRVGARGEARFPADQRAEVFAPFTAIVGQFTVRLVTLEPYPQTTDDIAFGDYRAILVVDKV